MVDFTKLNEKKKTITNTPEQQDFINQVRDTDDSIRLEAVAGSGKTTTLLQAARGLPADKKIIALAFNKAIADELGRKFPSYVDSKTLNSVGNGVWSQATGRKRVDSRKMSRLTTDWVKSQQLMPEEESVMWPAIRSIATALKSQGYVPPEWEARLQRPANIYDREVIEAIAIAQDVEFSSLIATGVEQVMLNSISEAFMSKIDFDDQIYMSTYFAPDEAWPEYDVVMVDEAQDLSLMQHDMIERLGQDARMIVVGDKHQAIYGWRGASTNSLDELEERFDLTRMPLTVSFRVPENVIKDARKIVPHIKAFKEGGTITRWNTPRALDDSEDAPNWYLEDIIAGSVILCRNNAPLVKIGFAMIQAGRPVFFANGDVGKGLVNIVKDLSDSIPLHHALDEWFEVKKDNLVRRKAYAALDKLQDKYDCLDAILLGVDAVKKFELVNGIEELFRKKYSEDAIELSTIHRSKGKEWNTVYLLNPELIPGKWILKAAQRGVPGADDLLEQEDNLLYVAVTRALDHLVYFHMSKDEPVPSIQEVGDDTTGESSEAG